MENDRIGSTTLSIAYEYHTNAPHISWQAFRSVFPNG